MFPTFTAFWFCFFNNQLQGNISQKPTAFPTTQESGNSLTLVCHIDQSYRHTGSTLSTALWTFIYLFCIFFLYLQAPFSMQIFTFFLYTWPFFKSCRFHAQRTPKYPYITFCSLLTSLFVPLLTCTKHEKKQDATFYLTAPSKLRNLTNPYLLNHCDPLNSLNS